MVWLPWIVWALLIGAAIGLVCYASFARAAKVNIDCSSLAQAVSSAAAFRDADANLEKTLAIFKRLNEDASRDEFAVLEREIRRVWREGLSQDEAALAIYKRCKDQLGDMGRES